MLDVHTFKVVIKNTPLVSIDLRLVCDDQVLLGKRNNDLLKGEWFTPGGRIHKMKPGRGHCLGLLKGIFFNEINALFKKSGTNETWNNFISALVKDKRIGNSHMDVPCHDGRLGFGGACLPKDSNAFLYYSESLGQPFNIL